MGPPLVCHAHDEAEPTKPSCARRDARWTMVWYGPSPPGGVGVRSMSATRSTTCPQQRACSRAASRRQALGPTGSPSATGPSRDRPGAHTLDMVAAIRRRGRANSVSSHCRRRLVMPRTYCVCNRLWIGSRGVSLGGPRNSGLFPWSVSIFSLSFVSLSVCKFVRLIVVAMFACVSAGVMCRTLVGFRPACQRGPPERDVQDVIIASGSDGSDTLPRIRSGIPW